MTVLQNILYPTEEKCTCTDLYWHDTDAGRVYDGYFNLFSSSKWAEYTELNSVALRLVVRETCEISIWSEQGLLTCRDVPDSGLDAGTSSERASVTIALPPLSQQRFLWFSVKQLPAESCSKADPLVRAAFVTDQEPPRAVRSAIAICTYRREDYVKRNLRSLCETTLQNPDSPLFGQIDILLVDNGRTLTAQEISAVTGGSSRVHLIPNRNAGGSGGFTRGMLEALDRQREEGYTHIILTDDDAVLEPDAFLRCHALLAYLKPAYRDHCVAGTMLDAKEPYRTVEAGALYMDGKPIPVGKDVNLRDRDAVIENEQTLHVDYAGWWWACFPLSTGLRETRQAEAGRDGIVRENNLPMPYFIHFDDMEYGLRSRGKVLYLNGICVWHESFDRRRPQADLYYGTRNRMITNAIHGSGSDRRPMLREELTTCLSEMVMGLMRYQYSASELVLEAVRDFTGGPQHFSRIDPEKRNQEIRDLTDEYVLLERLGVGDTESWAKQDGETTSMERSAAAAGHVSRRRYLLTLNGWLLPARRRRGSTPVCCSIFSPDMRALYRAEEGILVDPYAGKGTKVRKDYRKALHCIGLMAQVSALMLTRYGVCARAYRKHAGKLTSRNFWERYLEIPEKQERK